MRNLIRLLRGKPVELSPKQEEKMARARAKADAQIAKGEAEARKGQEEYAAFMASRNGGAAGIGSAPAPAPTTMQPGSVRDMFKQSFEQLRETADGMFDDRRDVLDPGPGANLNRPPAEEEDAARRSEIALAERTAREATRQPFKAPAPPLVAFTRFATTGGAQLEDVVATLRSTGLAAHPERVFGVYRVPDRFDHNRNSEAKAYLEWEIAHAPGALPPAADEILTSAFRRDSHWVTRHPGELSVLDEDVAGALVARARIEPEDCFGLTRLMQIRGTEFDDSTSWKPHIEGVLLFTRPRPAVTAAHQQLMGEAPLAGLPPLPYHLEILDWEAIAAWVSPYRWGPPRTPSPLPHLPSDPHELLVAYLEIVGVRSEDCYGVQITRTSETLLGDLSTASFRKNLGRRPKLPCADGEDRHRLLAAEHIVIAYRDRASYQDGRDRWRAYQHEVLRARLDHLSGARAPIEVSDRPRPSFLSEVFDMFNPLDPLHDFPQLFNRNERPSLGPYCGSLP